MGKRHSAAAAATGGVTPDIPNTETKASEPKRRGRPPGPRRVTVQMRVKGDGCYHWSFSFTVVAEPIRVMKILQELKASFDTHCRSGELLRPSADVEPEFAKSVDDG